MSGGANRGVRAGDKHTSMASGESLSLRKHCSVRVKFSFRDIERLLLVAPKKEAQMTIKDRGLLIVAVSGLRTWASGMSGTARDVSVPLIPVCNNS